MSGKPAYLDIDRENNPAVVAGRVSREMVAARGANRRPHFASDFIQMHVSGDDLHERIGNGDEGFVPVFLGLDHAGGAQQAAVRRTLGAFFDGVAKAHKRVVKWVGDSIFV